MLLTVVLLTLGLQACSSQPQDNTSIQPSPISDLDEQAYQFAKRVDTAYEQIWSEDPGQTQEKTLNVEG